MKRLAILLALLLAAPAAAQSSVSNRLIVSFDRNVGADRQLSLVDRAGGGFARRFGEGPILGGTIKPRRGMRLSRLRARLEALPGVRYAEPDYILEKQVTPNDPFFSQQYGLVQPNGADIDAPPAWDKRRDCARVAVLDTGVDTGHPDLKDNLWKNTDEKPNNGKDDDDNGYVDDYYGVNIITGKGNGEDDNGHGTNVSGIIAGRGNNGQGITGVCWTGSIEAIKFLNSRGKGATSDAIDGINYAVKTGAKIVNCSFGTSSKSESLQDAVDYAKDKGVLLVVAAGNDGEDIDSNPSYPASLTDGNILTVAASTPLDTLASFSNYGTKSVDLAAPGTDIFSAALNGRYGSLSGTSQATPFVSGAAAVLKKSNSKFDYSDLRSRIKGNVDKPQALKGKTGSNGRLNLTKALG